MSAHFSPDWNLPPGCTWREVENAQAADVDDCEIEWSEMTRRDHAKRRAMLLKILDRLGPFNEKGVKP